MNITFLMGNGFDIGVGLESKFEQFFPTYIDKSKNKSEGLKQLAIDIEIDCKKNGYYKTWADFEKALGEYTLQFDAKTKEKFIDQVLDFQADFNDYLKDEEQKLSFEENEDICDMMLKALTQYYLDDNLAPESKGRISAIYSSHATESHKYNFINYNYTGVLTNCLKTIPNNVVRKRSYHGEWVDKVGEIVHVHGKIGAHPIIGVNDVGQIANKELSEDSQFARFIVKPLMNQLVRQENDVNAKKLIDASTILCIYGMSLGSTDKKWWDSILNWLNNNKERQLVLFDYDKKYTPSSPIAWIKKEDTQIEKLADYNSNQNIDVEKLRSRIHIAVHKNIFQIDLRKESVRARRLKKIEETAQIAADKVREEQISKAVEEALKMTTA